MRRFIGNPVTLWLAFVLVHALLGLDALTFPDSVGTGDSAGVYPDWVDAGWATGHWVGIEKPWVYPLLALPPMIAADAFGKASAAVVWLTLAVVVNAVAFAFVIGFGRDRRSAVLGWWWLAFLLLLGPIALTRIDTWATAVSIIGALLIARRPRGAGALLAVAAWIKVWPAALVAAGIVAVRRRLAVLLGAVVGSVVAVAVGLLLGAGGNLTSFITVQSDRGLQIEAVLALPWMWWAAITHDRGVVKFDTHLVTFQVHGPGVAQVSAFTTPLLAVLVGAVLVLGILAARRRVGAPELLPVMMLGFTTALIVANKAGSPQYAGWLAVAVLLGLGARVMGQGITWRLPVIGSLAIAVLTQAVFPTFYDLLLEHGKLILIVLTLRNALYVALLVWAVVRLVQLVRRPPQRPLGQRVDDDGDWLPNVWPFARKD